MVHPGSAVARPLPIGRVRVAEVDLPALDCPASTANVGAFLDAIGAIAPALVRLLARGSIDLLPIATVDTHN